MLYITLELLVGGPLCRIDFVLRALWARRPCDPRNDVVSVRIRWGKNCGIPTDGPTDKAFLGVGWPQLCSNANCYLIDIYCIYYKVPAC